LGSNCNECCFAYVKTYETLSNFIKEKNTHLEKERKEHQEKTNIQSTNNIQKCEFKNKAAKKQTRQKEQKSNPEVLLISSLP